MHPRKELEKFRELVEKSKDVKYQEASVAPEDLPAFQPLEDKNPIEILEKNTVVRPKGRPKGSISKNVGFKKKDSEEVLKARRTLWRKGILAEMKLDKMQLELYKKFKNRTDSLVVWVSGRQTGKCLTGDTKVMTPVGPKTINEIQVGDYVIGYDGEGKTSPTKVLGKQYQGEQEVVDLVYNRDILATCTLNHRWVKLNELTGNEEIIETSDITDYTTLISNLELDYVGVRKENLRIEETWDILIDNETHLYLTADGLVTHNSFTALTTVMEACLQTAGLRVAYVSPQKAQTRDVVEKNIHIILADCPDQLRPKYDQQRGMWKFNNGSIMKVAGIDGGHVESLRGQTFDIVVVDEAGFPSAQEFEYAMESVIFPTMTRATNPVLLLFSTPPVNYDHPFNDYWEKAEVTGNFILKTIYDSTLPKSQIADIEARYGIDSIAFRREFKCERIADTNALVIPEATRSVMEDIVVEHKRPPFYQTYVVADYGVMDLNAIIFAYYDFREDVIVIEDELKLAGAEYDTRKMAECIKAKELELWGEGANPMRYCDNNLQIIMDFASIYNLNFMATDKKNKHSHVNIVREKVSSQKIHIDPKCENTINHIQNAVWDKDRKKFRKAIGHHYDFLDCVIYLVRNIDYRSNPYPAHYDEQGMYLSPKYLKMREGEGFVNQLKQMFTPRKTRNNR